MSQFIRPSGRAADALRPVRFTPHFTAYAEGSVLVEVGNTKVLCNCSVLNEVPRFLVGKEQGWVTAEYSLLPRATHTRNAREAAKGKQSGRTLEIQRLIGRSLRGVVDLKALGGRTLHLDCDVLQADGGTRCASITGAWVAMAMAVQGLLKSGDLQQNPILSPVAAVSVGIYQGQEVLDLDYAEDSHCDADINVVMTGKNALIEVQGTAEGAPFSREQFDRLLDMAQSGIQSLIAEQCKALNALDGVEQAAEQPGAESKAETEKDVEAAFEEAVEAAVERFLKAATKFANNVAKEE